MLTKCLLTAYRWSACPAVRRYESRQSNVSGKSLVECEDSELKSILEKDLILIEDFISPEEETSLLNEIEPYMKKLRYEYDHWDDVNKTFLGVCCVCVSF